MNDLVINFYKEQVKNMFKNLKDNNEKIVLLENRIKYLEETLNTYVNKEKNIKIEEDPFIKSVIHFLDV
jgi:hypothetical protein